MPTPQSVRLFIKPGCPWCHEAIDWLTERGVRYEALDVIRDAEARTEMHALTGQSKAPSIDVDGQIRGADGDACLDRPIQGAQH
jgi:monothiol glutaredoxin